MKRIISFVLAVLFALPFGSMSCFALKQNDPGYEIKKDANGNTYICIYTNEKKDENKKDSNVGDYVGLIKLLAYMGAIGYGVYKFGGPLVNVVKGLSSAWHVTGDGCRWILGYTTGVTNKFNLLKASFLDFISRNSSSQEGKSYFEREKEKIENSPLPQDLTNFQAVATELGAAVSGIAVGVLGTSARTGNKNLLKKSIIYAGAAAAAVYGAGKDIVMTGLMAGAPFVIKRITHRPW